MTEQIGHKQPKIEEKFVQFTKNHYLCRTTDEKTMKEYKSRVADILLARKLGGKGAVLIEGPKWCGKTTTAQQLAKSILDLGNMDTLKQSRQMMEISPSTLLLGETPRLIDEWQTIPSLWDNIRTEVDARGEVAQFILTGSSVPPQTDETIHSGTGRFGRIRMRPMSLFESGESSGCITLNQLFNGESFTPQVNKLDLNKIAFLTCRGGWPQAGAGGSPGTPVQLTDDRNPVYLQAEAVKTDKGKDIVVFQKIHPGYHTYAVVPSDEVFVVTTVEIKLPAGYEKVGPLYVPEAQLLDASGTTVYRGTGEFRQAVKGEGEGEAIVTVTYQCCNNNTCLVPETKTFTVKL